MRILSTCLGIVVVLLLAAFFYEQRQTRELKASLAEIGRDREAMQSELRQLNAQIVELKKRPVAPPTAAGTAAKGDAPPATALATPVPPPERPGVTTKAPAGWAKNGAKPEFYVVGVDTTETWGGMPSAYVQSLTPTVEGGFGGMMQTTSAESYIGKRVRLSGWIKTQDAAEGGQLWLRVDGQERGQALQFDNMNNRAVKGTSDWQEASVVLDVPPGASALAYGFFVKGGGKMWVNGQRIEEVGPEVPSTNMYKKPILPAAPRNLGFDPNQPK
jgi:hypothetical protein